MKLRNLVFVVIALGLAVNNVFAVDKKVSTVEKKVTATVNKAADVKKDKKKVEKSVTKKGKVTPKNADDTLMTDDDEDSVS